MLGAIVQRIGAAIWAFDAQLIGVVVAGNEKIEVTSGAAIGKRGLQHGVAPPVHADRAAGVEHAGLGLDVDNATCHKAIFGGQRAIDDLHTFGQPWIDALAEH